MTPSVAVVSFRLGGTDGVSVEASKWEWALRTLGFTPRRVAGEILDGGRADDVILPELAIGADADLSPPAFEAALDGADVVIVENLLSLPLNLRAARVVAKVVDGYERVVLHHHDLPWQRREWEAVDELPPRIDHAIHVVINDLSRRQLAERGFEAHLIRNHFNLEPAAGDRVGMRRRLGLGDADVLVLHPVRAIARKNVPGALTLCRELDARLPRHRIHYWLPGPAEDGYAPELETLLEEVVRESRVRVIREPMHPVGDAYAACDVVTFPSTWEGFGNPVMESVAHRRPLAVHHYPVLAELTELGFEFLGGDDAAAVAAVVSGVRDLAPTMERNLDLARAHLDLDLLPGRIEALLGGAGSAAGTT